MSFNQNSSNRKRILLLGYKNLATNIFDFILDQSDVEVVGIISKDYPLALTAREKLSKNKIPVFENIKEIGNLSFDLGISINFWELIKQPILGRPSIGFVNAHHAYNLRFRGRHCTTFAIQRARQDNIWHHGTTLHFIEERLDAGKIIASQACPIFEQDTAKDLFERVETLSITLLKEWLPRVWRENVITYEPPNEFYVHRDADLRDKHVMLDENPLVTYDKVRSMTFYPYPPPFGMCHGRKRALLIKPGECAEVAQIGEGERNVYWGDFIE